MQATTDRHYQSWIWLIIGFTLLLALTIHGQYLLAQKAGQLGSGDSFIQVTSLDDRPDLFAEGKLRNQSLLSSVVFEGKAVSRIYAALMHAKEGQELENK